MIKWVGIFAAGAAIGAGVVLLLTWDGVEGERVSVPEAGKISAPATARIAAPVSRAISLAEIQQLPNRFNRFAAMYELLGSADVRAVEDLLEEADALPSEGGSLRSVIYLRYVQLAPRAAVTRIRAEEGDRPAELMHALAAWASVDFDAALGFVETLEPSLQNQAAMYILREDEHLSDSRKEQIARRFSVEPYLRQLQASAEARMDPASAWRNALSMEEGESRTYALWGIADTWINEDPAAALSALNSLPDRTRDGWQQSLLQRWAGTDREAAWDWALAQPRTKRAMLLASVAAAVAEDSASEMLAIADTLDPEERRAIAQKVLEAWARTDPKAALSALQEMADPQLTQAVQHSLIFWWTQSDPRSAFEWVRTQPPSSGQSTLLATTLGAYAISDPEQALGLASNLDGGHRSRVIENILRQWADQDPRAAAVWLDSSPDKTPTAVSAVVGGYAKLDPEAAFDWLMDQSAGAQSQSVSIVVGAVAAKSPAAAQRLIARIDDREARRIAGSQLMSTWVETDPRAAVRAIARMDDDSSKQLYQSAFQSWSGFDREGATVFLNQIPASSRDWAINGILTQALFGGDTAFAERMYSRLSGHEVRQEAARMLYFLLSRSDPERAQRYREISGIQLDENGQIRTP